MPNLRTAAAALVLAVLSAAPAEGQLGLRGRTADSAARQDSIAADHDVRRGTGTVIPVDSASPRASIERFLAVVRAGDFAAASAWLDPAAPEVDTRGEELARRLTAVLDTHLSIDVETLSPLAVGDTADGLRRDRERLGEVIDDEKRMHPIYLARRVDGDQAGWMFSRSTVNLVDMLYDELPDAWIRAHLPTPLLSAGPFGVLWWQWLGLLTVIVLSMIIGWLLAAPTQLILKKLVANTDTDLDDALVASTRGPVMLLWGLAASRVLLDWIALGPLTMGFIVELQRAIAVIAVFWVFLRAIGVVQDALPRSDWATRHPALRTLIPFGGRIARVLIFAIGLLTVVATFGYPVATILAGLGIGGIAVALGAQKSLEHFFGSVSIGIDQPFRVGDWVTVAGVSGDIEEIGLRSTRIRTQERTLVSIPNGVLAEMQSENFGQRDRFALKTTIGLEYGTTSETLRKIRDDIHGMLLAHPKIWEEKAVVHFRAFGASSLDIEILCWLTVENIDEFKAVREGIFMDVMAIVERHGSSFAFPTQTIHMRHIRTDGRAGPPGTGGAHQPL